MKVEVTMPEEYMGDVIGDINSRRGRIEGMDDLGGGRSYVHTYRFLRCSATLQTFVPEHRDVVTTPCSSRNTNQYRRMFRKRYYPIKKLKKA